ncbi:MAG: ABC transporter permease subunit [Lachnospiraceae bacterium]|nr:ABC transporter permease subunit [Lachnospiraceae bacterium]
MQLLIQLELSKLKKIKRYILSCVLITTGMCLFTTISLFAIEQDRATNYNNAVKMMNAAIIDCYLIFSGVLVTRVIVEEYIKRTALILFTYSVSRRHIMMAKVLLILGITVCFAIITELISITYLIVAGPHMKLALNTFSEADFVYWLTQFCWGIILIISFTLLNISMAFIKKTNQHVFLTSLLSVIIAQILISQDIQKLSLILGVLFIILTEISIKKFADKIA